MTKPIKQSLKDHYRRFVLTPEQVQELARLSGRPKGRPSTWRSRRAALWGAAAAAALVVIGAAYWLIRGQQSQLDAIVAEMSHNHSKRFEPEVATDSYEEIRRRMTKLDFSVAQSSQLSAGQWVVSGARYCSVRGVTAARIGLVNRGSSAAYTLYQAPIPAGLDLQGSVERLHGGNKVTLWVEHGLLFGLVGPP